MEQSESHSADEYEYEYDDVETEVGFALNHDAHLPLMNLIPPYISGADSLRGY